MSKIHHNDLQKLLPCAKQLKLSIFFHVFFSPREWDTGHMISFLIECPVVIRTTGHTWKSMTYQAVLLFRRKGCGVSEGVSTVLCNHALDQ